MVAASANGGATVAPRGRNDDLLRRNVGKALMIGFVCLIAIATVLTEQNLSSPRTGVSRGPVENRSMAQSTGVEMPFETHVGAVQKENKASPAASTASLPPAFALLMNLTLSEKPHRILHGRTWPVPSVAEPPPSEYVDVHADPRLVPKKHCVPPSSIRARWLLREMPSWLYSPARCVAGEDNVEVLCGCYSRAIDVPSVFFAMRERRGSTLLDVSAATNATSARQYPAVVDRVSTHFNLNRCLGVWGEAPRIRMCTGRIGEAMAQGTFQRLTANVTLQDAAQLEDHAGRPRCCGPHLLRDGRVVEEAFYASDFVVFTPGHSLEAIVEGLGQYYAAGLHRRRVPWVLPNPLRRNHFLQVFNEIADILQEVDFVLLPPPSDVGQTVTFVARVWFANTQLGNAAWCYKPFVQNVLFPRALRQLRDATNGTLPVPHRRIALLKLTGDKQLFSAQRAMELTDGFAKLCSVAGIHVARAWTIRERLYFIQQAELIVTNFGASATFVSLLMTRREQPQRVLILVTSGYGYEFEDFLRMTSPDGVEVHPQTGATRAVVFHKVAPRTSRVGYPMAAPHLKVKYLRIQSLDDVTEADITF